MTFIIGTATLAYLTTEFVTLYNKSEPTLMLSE